MDQLLPFLGIALIAVAMLQFGLWTGRGLRLRSLEKKRFDVELAKLRAEIWQIRNSSPEPIRTPAPADTRPAPTEEASTAPAEKPLARGDWTGYRKFVVSKLVPETRLCTSVCLVPADGNPIVSWQPGQHLTLRFPIPGQSGPPVRCYTLSDAPGKDHYRISVKKVLDPAGDAAAGLVSSFVNDQLKEGDTVEVKSPGGTFCLQPGTDPVVLLAGGIGITPMLSAINSIAESGSGRECLLLYGVKNSADHAFRDHLHELATRVPNIHVITCYSDPLESDQWNVDYQVAGYVSADILKQVLPHRNYDFYLCGPPPFMHSLFEGLTGWGVDENRIRFEAFGPASILKTKSSAPAGSAEHSLREVRFDQSGRTETWNGDQENLLEFMETLDIAVDSGCRAGNCGTCATRLLKGRVEYDSPEQIECEPGYCLPCVARPMEAIEIDA